MAQAGIPNVTVQFAVTQTSRPLVGIGLGSTRTMRGFAPATLNGAAPGSFSKTTETWNPTIPIFGTYLRTNTLTTFALGTVASSATLTLPVAWGATARAATGIAVADLGLAAHFDVIVTFLSNGVPFAQLTSPGLDTLATAGLL